MALIEINRKLWNDEYEWKAQGDEWSSGWGGVDMQWYGVLLPRIHHFLPTGTLLEIAPGQGRWTQYLAPMAKKLIAVDLSPKCIQVCSARFSSLNHVSFYVNDGATLGMIEDGSVDFVFSFDSLVHCEGDVIESYISELSKKLSENGIGFVHHSNMAGYSTYFRMIKKIPRGAGLLSKMGLIEAKEHFRAHSMSAKRFAALCHRYNLHCISKKLSIGTLNG